MRQHTCPHCSSLLEAEEDFSGKEVSCPQCGKAFFWPYTYTCPHCQATVKSDNNCEGFVITCPGCKQKFSASKSESHFSHLGKEFFSSVSDTLTNAANVKNIEGFKIKTFFSEIFKHHTQDDVENVFSGIHTNTTDAPQDMSFEWPKPWFFIRAMLWACILTTVSYFLSIKTGNPNNFPLFFFLGSFSVPLATLIFFFEINFLKNISIYRVFSTFLSGTVISFVLLSIVCQILELNPKLDTLWGATTVGLLEETAKVATVFFLTKNFARHYKINAMLIGAAVGAGFGCFETMGYIFNAFSDNLMEGAFEISQKAQNAEQFYAILWKSIYEGLQSSKNVMLLRAMTSNFLGHIPWTAMSAVSLCRCYENGNFKSEKLHSKSFLCLFLIPVALHTLWDYQFFDLHFAETSNLFTGLFVKFGLLGIIAWIYCIALLGEGIAEVKKELQGLLP